MNGSLFEKRIIVGRKIKKYMEDNSITKSSLCEISGLSRPTLNKMLAGEITNRKTFETHLGKIFAVMQIKYDEILEDRCLVFAERLNQFFSLNLSPIDVAGEIGVSEEKIRSWLNGESFPSDDELSDLAYYLGTSAKHLTNEFYIELESAWDDRFFHNNDECSADRFSGYWGHIAIQLPEMDKMKVYPITAATYDNCYKSLQYKKYICFPTLNNRFVMFNQDNVEYVVFIDDDCDDYPNAEVTIAEAPWSQELYRCMSKYHNGIEDSISPRMLLEIEAIKKKYSWDEDVFFEKTEQVYINLKGGRCILCTPIDYDSIAFNMDLEYNDGLEENTSIIISEFSGEELFIRKNNIALLDAPLIEVEDSMEKMYLDM